MDRAQTSVYFAQDGCCGEIKIGCSVNPRRRLGDLRTARPSLRFVAVIRGWGKQREESLHATFWDCHVDREWFEPSRALVTFINGLFDTSDAIGRMIRHGAEAREKHEGECFWWRP